MAWCPASPLVTDTNFTACPSFAKSAAVPAARMSQSSGCAPKAITWILLSCASSVVIPTSINTKLFINEFLPPSHYDVKTHGHPLVQPLGPLSHPNLSDRVVFH